MFLEFLDVIYERFDRTVILIHRYHYLKVHPIDHHQYNASFSDQSF
jgi:oligoribonuclease NrnB/cAMP/cGMP phosphodiesterase (DHH superfamily)